MPDRRRRATATGTLVAAMPPGPDRDELLHLVRLGVAIDAQHVGRRPGVLAREVRDLARRIDGPVTFEAMLEQLELAAVRRELRGERASPVESINRVWGVVTYHEHGARKQATFKRVANILTQAKKKLREEIPPAPNTGTRPDNVRPTGCALQPAHH